MAEKPTGPVSVLAREYAAYKSLQAKLWDHFQGGFTLIKGDKLIGVYPNKDMALAKGRERFGAQAFMVKEIYAPGMEPVRYITREFVR